MECYIVQLNSGDIYNGITYHIVKAFQEEHKAEQYRLKLKTLLEKVDKFFSNEMNTVVKGSLEIFGEDEFYNDRVFKLKFADCSEVEFKAYEIREMMVLDNITKINIS